ncbi:TIGR03085 family metal-binding protein [Brevibacterium spongiae]|uniref:TIGR03085 family metal-binding protein n=1 Tax=Brevibacterium spongiae TaxID=2909672 RepID=A0ABY5SS85_9MICO|nr:TIGR03085 family metal-binding protein [Brevibacterium spongiae]UVI36995.1 TIGR03085 family metal-binding protein [Brevibacterium spongiae]
MRDNLARAERLRLVDSARRAGEDAPTLCEGWNVRDLATHLIIRERHPSAALGNFVSKLEPRRDSTVADYAQMPFAQLLGLVAAPPKWTPGALPGIEPVMNTMEFVVHHEDIRRAAIEWIPRRLSQAENSTIWAQTKVALLPFAAKAKGPVTITAPGFGSRTVGKKRSGEAATITGAPLELLLYLMGREDHALVDVR